MADSLVRYRPYIAMLFLIVLVLAGTVLVLRRPEPVILTATTATPRPTPTLAPLLVDVRGAVVRPGVYALSPGSRVQDALALAGGVSPNAETRPLNLARKLNDGEQIIVPTVAEATQTAAATPARAERGPSPTRTAIGKININTATVELLDLLPGIGPAIAQRIVDYRDQNGAFKKPEDLKQVRGIGDALYEQIKDLITLQ